MKNIFLIWQIQKKKKNLKLVVRCIENEKSKGDNLRIKCLDSVIQHLAEDIRPPNTRTLSTSHTIHWLEDFKRSKSAQKFTIETVLTSTDNKFLNFKSNGTHNYDEVFCTALTNI